MINDFGSFTPVTKFQKAGQTFRVRLMIVASRLLTHFEFYPSWMRQGPKAHLHSCTNHPNVRTLPCLIEVWLIPLPVLPVGSLTVVKASGTTFPKSGSETQIGLSCWTKLECYAGRVIHLCMILGHWPVHGLKNLKKLTEHEKQITMRGLVTEVWENSEHSDKWMSSLLDAGLILYFFRGRRTWIWNQTSNLPLSWIVIMDR